MCHFSHVPKRGLEKHKHFMWVGIVNWVLAMANGRELRMDRLHPSLESFYSNQHLAFRRSNQTWAELLVHEDNGAYRQTASSRWPRWCRCLYLPAGWCCLWMDVGFKRTNVRAQDFNTGANLLGDSCSRDWFRLEAWTVECPGKKECL